MFGTAGQSTGGMFGNTGSSGFGNNNAPGASTGSNTGFSFGSNQNTNSGGLFGKQPANAATGGAAPATGGLFGGSTATNGQASGNLFGSTGNTLGAAGANASGALGGAFGTSSTTGGNTGGLFGVNNASKPATSLGLFGGGGSTAATAPGAGGGLFGNASNTTASTGGSLFGNKPNVAGSNTTTGGGLFGATTVPAGGNSGGLFGNASNSGATSTTGGLFGNTNSNTSATSSLFGAKAATTGSSLFGGNQATTTTGGLFGGQQQQQQQLQQSQQQQQQLQQPQQQPSFGWNKPQATTSLNSSLFNQTTTNQDTNSLALPSTSNSLTMAPKNGYAPSINDQLTKIIEDWDPASPKCVFKSHLYNKMGENEMQLLMNQPRPQNETAEDWDSAMRSRPSNLHYPVKITSFSEVATRVQVQIQHVAKSRSILTDINEKLQALSAKHELDNTTRILKAKAHHTRLSRRLLRLATVLAIVKLKGYPLLPEEEETSRQFEMLNSKLSDPNSPLSKFTDLFARVMLLKERAEEFNHQFNDALMGMNEEPQNGSKADETSKDEDDQTNALLNKLARILMKQQMGLNYVNEVLGHDQEVLGKLIQK